MAKRTTITLRLSDDDLYWKLVTLARHLDRSLNGAAQECLKYDIFALTPRQEMHTKPLSNFSADADKGLHPRQQFVEHLDSSGSICVCTVPTKLPTPATPARVPTWSDGERREAERKQVPVWVHSEDRRGK